MFLVNKKHLPLHKETISVQILYKMLPATFIRHTLAFWSSLVDKTLWKYLFSYHYILVKVCKIIKLINQCREWTLVTTDIVAGYSRRVAVPWVKLI